VSEILQLIWVAIKQWDAQTVSFYKKDKKARFQNSEYYFKIGIGIPMVKSSKIKATLLDACLFDQSIVGIFPKDAARNQYILALMNSTVVNELIHAINPTANNSANYIKQIPYIEPDVETMNEITTKVNQIISYEKSGEFEKSDQLQIQLDEIITGIYSEFSSHI
jgi:adenine-specific DNA-methyltransferase